MGSHDGIFLDIQIRDAEERAKKIKRQISMLFSGKGYGNDMEMEELEWLVDNKDKILRNRQLIDLIG